MKKHSPLSSLGSGGSAFLTITIDDQMNWQQLKLSLRIYVESAILSKRHVYYHFILMDIEMPAMDGFEATMQIRKLPNRIRANIPIIALTANAIPENRERAAAVGMDGFLVKPINTARLLGSLAKFL